MKNEKTFTTLYELDVAPFFEKGAVRIFSHGRWFAGYLRGMIFERPAVYAKVLPYTEYKVGSERKLDPLDPGQSLFDGSDKTLGGIASQQKFRLTDPQKAVSSETSDDCVSIIFKEGVAIVSKRPKDWNDLKQVFHLERAE